MNFPGKIALTLALAAVASPACSLIYSNVRHDSLPSGTVVVTKARFNLMLNDTVTTERDTIAVSRPADMKAHFNGYFLDSALVFVGKIDTGFFVTETDPPSLSTAWILHTPLDTVASAPRMYLKFSIDTVLRGSLPSKSFWVRAKTNPAMCGFSAPYLQGKTFINASSGFTKLADLKAPEGEGVASLAYFPGFPAAEFFDGRYFVSPKFPGLTLDVTEVLPGYPVAVRGARSGVRPPLRAPGKAYRLDGREVPEGARPGKTPAPLVDKRVQ